MWSPSAIGPTAFSRCSGDYFFSGVVGRCKTLAELHKLVIPPSAHFDTNLHKRVSFLAYLPDRDITVVGYDGCHFAEVHHGEHCEQTRVWTHNTPLCVCENRSGHEVVFAGVDGFITIKILETVD